MINADGLLYKNSWVPYFEKNDRKLKGASIISYKNNGQISHFSLTQKIVYNFQTLIVRELSINFAFVKQVKSTAGIIFKLPCMAMCVFIYLAKN